VLILSHIFLLTSLYRPKNKKKIERNNKRTITERAMKADVGVKILMEQNIYIGKQYE